MSSFITKACTEVALQLTTPSLCVGNYISLMESEVTCSLASDISLQASQLKQSTQDYTNRSAWLGCVSPLQHYLYEQKYCTYFYWCTLSTNAVWGVKFSQKAYQLGVAFIYCLEWKEHFSVWNFLAFTSYLKTWQHHYRLLDYLLNCWNKPYIHT